MSKYEDSELLHRAKSGDRDAFNQLVERHGPGLLVCISRLIRNLDDAEEICQDVLLVAIKGLGRFEERSSFFPWLIGIAHRKCAAFWRDPRRRMDYQSPDHLDQRVAGVSSTENSDNKDLFLYCQKVASDVLKLRDRALLRFRIIEGMSYEEIAQRWGRQAGTLRARFKRAIAKLLSHMEAAGAMLGSDEDSVALLPFEADSFNADMIVFVETSIAALNEEQERLQLQTGVGERLDAIAEELKCLTDFRSWYTNRVIRFLSHLEEGD